MKKINVPVTATSVVALAAVGTIQAAAQEGPYVGIWVGVPGGNIANDSDSDYDVTSDTASGFFAGYNNMTSNGWVTGTEVSVHNSDIISGDDDYSLNNLVDVKLRAGKYVAGFGEKEVLVYGFAGGSFGALQTDSGDDGYSSTGYNIGAGAEMDIGGNFFAGVELTRRVMENHYADGDGPVANSTISFRAGLRF